MATPKTKTRNSPGQGTIKPRTLANGEIVFDAWVTVINPKTGKSEKLAKRNAGSTRAEAQTWIDQQKADALAGRTALVARGWTVQTCWDTFKASTPLKESTVLEYERVLNALSRDMWDVPIAAVTQLRFDTMVKGLKAKGIPVTRLVHLIESWVHVFEGAILAEAIRGNPAKESPWRLRLTNTMLSEQATREQERKEAGIAKVITTPQYLTLLNTERRTSLRNLWEGIGQTGLRRGEVLALQWAKDINLNDGVIWIRRGIADIGGKLVHLDTPKGGRARRIYIDEVTVDLLRRQRRLIDEYRSQWGDQWEEHDLVFPLLDIRKSNKHRPGHWMLPSNLSVAYFRRATKLGFDSTKLHGLRYRWATMAFAAGVDPRDIQEHMGHRSLDLTMFTYVETSEERQRQAARKAGRALRGEELPSRPGEALTLDFMALDEDDE